MVTVMHHILHVMEVLTKLYGMNRMMVVGGTMVNGMMNGMNINGPMTLHLPRMHKLLFHLKTKSDFKMLSKLSKSLNNLQLRPNALGKRPRKPPDS